MVRDNSIEQLDYDEMDNTIENIARDNSLFGLVGAVYDEMHLKIAFLLFIIFCIINTDIFAEHVLGRLSAKNYDRSQDKISDRGIVTAGLVMSGAYIVIDMLNAKEII